MPPPVVVVDANRWRPVRGYKGFYRVSDCGRVRSVTRKAMVRGGSFRTIPGQRIRPSMVKGYRSLTLHRNQDLKRMYVHRLVAEAFIPNPNDLPFINHKDGNKLNNHHTNLEWCSHRENTDHAVAMGLHPYGTRVWNAKLDDRRARKIFRAPGKLKTIARKFNVSVMTISLIKRRKIWRRATEGLCHRQSS